MISRILRVGVVASAALMFASVAGATTLNLTTAGSFGTLDGALFVQGPTQSGTGVFPAFVQVAGNNLVKSAYNTEVNGTLDNGSSPTFNHSIQVSDLVVVTLGQTSFYVFALDINENNNAANDQYLSLDDIIVATGTVKNPSTTDPLALGTVRYNLSDGNVIGLNYALQPGSGAGDMFMLIPVANFAGALSTDYVYLYSKFGALGLNPSGLPAGIYNNSDGFEEWALLPVQPQITNFCTTNPNDPTCQEIPEVPEPATLLMLGTGLAALAVGMRKLRA